MSSVNDGSMDAVRDGRCPKCAGRLFEIIPQQTTWHAIEEFLQAAEFEGADVALAERLRLVWANNRLGRFDIVGRWCRCGISCI